MKRPSSTATASALGLSSSTVQSLPFLATRSASCANAAGTAAHTIIASSPATRFHALMFCYSTRCWSFASTSAKEAPLRLVSIKPDFLKFDNWFEATDDKTFTIEWHGMLLHVHPFVFEIVRHHFFHGGIACFLVRPLDPGVEPQPWLVQTFGTRPVTYRDQAHPGGPCNGNKCEGPLHGALRVWCRHQESNHNLGWFKPSAQGP